MPPSLANLHRCSRFVPIGTTTERSSTVLNVIAALDDAGLPPLAGHEMFSTQFEFVPVALIVAALVVYLWAVRRNNALHPRHPWSAVKTGAWLGALFTTAVSIFSFIGVYDGELFWDHMVQHLLLIMVAAPLFAIASPLDLAWRSTTGTAHLAVSELLALEGGHVLGPSRGVLRALRRVDTAQPPDQLVQPHPRAREHPQRRAPGLLGGRLPVLAPDLRQRPQPLPHAPGPAVLLPVHGHPHRHLHRALLGRGQQRAVPRLLRHGADARVCRGVRCRTRGGPPTWSTSTSGATSCGWWATPSCCGP